VFVGAGALAREEDASEILIAVAGPMSGQYAAFGRAMQAGAQSAVDDINAAGGIGKGKLKLLIEDDACDRAKAVAVAERLVLAKAALVVGHHCDSASIAAAPIYAAASIIQISPGTTEASFTDKRAGPTIFRLAYRNDDEGSVSGTYLAERFAGKRVAILHDRTVVGIQLAAQTKKAMNAAGLKEVLNSGFVAGERDYTQLARDLKAYRIDAAYLGAYPSEVDLIYSALRSEGLTTTVVGSNLLSGAFMKTPVSPLQDGVLLTTIAGLPPQTGTLKSGMGRTTGDTLALIKVTTHAAFEIWAQATQTTTLSGGTGATGNLAVKIQQERFQTSLGSVSFNKKGDAMVPFFRMYSWRGGQLVPAP
jgi:branched-chain amino acid transport system substrate-binding protein